MNLNFYNIGKFCAGIRLNEREDSRIDLSSVSFFSPFALVYLGMYLRHHNSLGCRFIVQAPGEPAPRDYLATQQFWERFNFDEKTIKQEGLRRFTTSTSLNDIVDIENHAYIGDDIGEQVKRVLISNGYYGPVKQIALAVSELVDNFAQHSQRNLAALALQYFPRRGSMSLAIADCGVGIRASVSDNPKYRWLEKEPHHTAALEALKPGVSRKPEGGIGFVDVLDGVEEFGGQLRLATGDEYIIVRKRRATYGPMHHNLPGVQIELLIPAGKKFG